MNKYSIIGLIGFWATCHGKSGELYSSLVHMNDLFIFDDFVGKLLRFMPTYLPEVQRYKESHECLTKDISCLAKGDLLNVAITGHPLHTFSVIKRLVLFWPEIKRSIKTLIQSDYRCTDDVESCKFWASWSQCELNPSYMRKKCPLSCGFCAQPELEGRVNDLHDLENQTVLPITNDLRGASLALARLQQIYRIPISEMVEGTIAGVSTCVRLSIFDCIRIANESYHEGQYASSYQWYHYAAGLSHDPEMKSLIRTLQAPVAAEHDAQFIASSQKFFPNYLSRFSIQRTWDTRYSKLCRGINLMDAVTAASLKCYVSSRGSPFLTLRPIKYEQLHLDPELYMFYDVIGDNEIKAIKEVATTKLSRSRVINSDKAVEHRVSQTAWLSNITHPLFPGIARRISAVTGLHVYEGTNYFAGEPLQVLSYGIGGHYREHYDLLWKFDKEENWESLAKGGDFDSGDRIATWMFYLSEVEAGGRTAFPEAGISTKPVKGAAVFWYNLKRNGQFNLRSRHGGCPVLLGHKWATNKWIREHINFIKRPCALDPHL